jgi:hypothetical protein
MPKTLAKGHKSDVIVDLTTLKKTPKKDKKKSKESAGGYDKTRLVSSGLTHLAPEVESSTNSKEWSKFLAYIGKRMLTFDKNSSTYIDYAQREIERNQPPKRCIVIRK